MFRYLKSQFAAKAPTAATTITSKTLRLSLESFEERALPSASLTAHITMPVAVHTISPNTVSTSLQVLIGNSGMSLIANRSVPNLSGLSFYLKSANGAPDHTLIVQTQTTNVNGSATFTGTWSGDGTNVNQITNGTISRDAQGNVAIAFGWNSHTFAGTITSAASTSILGPQYYLQGTVTSPGGGGPGNVSGYSHPTIQIPIYEIGYESWNRLSS